MKKHSKFLALFLALSLTLGLLAACGSASSSAAPSDKGEAQSVSTGEAAPAAEGGLSGKITVWSWDIALAFLQEAAAKFQEANPDVEFVFEEMGTEQIYDKLTVSLATGSGLPDVVSLEGEVFAKYGTSFPDGFIDFTDTISQDDFLKIKLAEATVNDRILAYPWDAAPCALWYRTDVFEEAGVDPESIKTWDDLIAAGETIKEKTGHQLLPMASSRNDTVYRILMMECNGWYFSGEGDTQVNSPESIKAMDVVKKLYDSGLTQDHADWDDYVGTITGDKVATFAEAVWMGGSIKEEAPDMEGLWRVMDLPMVDDTSTGAACNGGSVVAIPAVTESPEAAKAFVEFAMTDIDLQLYALDTYGLYPSYIPTYDNAVFTEGDPFFGGQAVNALFAEIGQKIPFVNYTENFAEATDSSRNAVAQVTLEGADVTETMNKLQDELVAKFGK